MPEKLNQDLPNLKKLIIADYPQLEQLPQLITPDLEELNISRCVNLDPNQLLYAITQLLPNLEKLIVYGCDQLTPNHTNGLPKRVTITGRDEPTASKSYGAPATGPISRYRANIKLAITGTWGRKNTLIIRA